MPAALALPDTDWHLEPLYDFLDALGASVLDSTGLVPVDSFHREALYLRGEAPEESEVRFRKCRASSAAGCRFKGGYITRRYGDPANTFALPLSRGSRRGCVRSSGRCSKNFSASDVMVGGAWVVKDRHHDLEQRAAQGYKKALTVLLA